MTTLLQQRIFVNKNESVLLTMFMVALSTKTKLQRLITITIQFTLVISIADGPNNNNTFD